MPPSILTLSLQNNHISKFPLELVDSLPSLTWFILRGNYIENIPTNPLLSVSRHDGGGKRHLDKVRISIIKYLSNDQNHFVSDGKVIFIKIRKWSLCMVMVVYL